MLACSAVKPRQAGRGGLQQGGERTEEVCWQLRRGLGCCSKRLRGMRAPKQPVVVRAAQQVRLRSLACSPLPQRPCQHVQVSAVATSSSC